MLTEEAATFVIPHWTPRFDRSRRQLDAALSSIFQQTDRNWRIVLVDDASPDPAARAYLAAIAGQHPGRVHAIFRDANEGAGVCRNVGVQWAQAQRSPIVLFNDADDLSDPHRLERVRGAFLERPAAGVVYSTFHVIDQDGRHVPLDEMTASVAEVLEEHRRGPPQGADAWIAIGTETGYVNHTSSTAVVTELAARFPFPAERVSEDAHTWLRYSAGGGSFVYLDAPLSSYRTTRDVAGSTSRSREGGKRGFYAAKARVDAEGFQEAIRIALARGAILPEQRAELMARFYLRLGQTLAGEGEVELAAAQVRAALAAAPGVTSQLIAARGLGDRPWVRVIAGG